MVCPCRVVLAGLSAFVAIFLIWHVKTSADKKCADKVEQVLQAGRLAHISIKAQL